MVLVTDILNIDDEKECRDSGNCVARGTNELLDGFSGCGDGVFMASDLPFNIFVSLVICPN